MKTFNLKKKTYNYIFFFNFYSFFFKKIKVGLSLKFVFIGFKILAKSFKSKLKVLSFKKTLSIFKLKMPSGAVCTTTLVNFLALKIEQAAGAFSKKFNLLKKKASFSYYNNKKPKTRGVAKNCVDHPNGGKGRNGVHLKRSPRG